MFREIQDFRGGIFSVKTTNTNTPIPKIISFFYIYSIVNNRNEKERFTRGFYFDFQLTQSIYIQLDSTEFLSEYFHTESLKFVAHDKG